MQLSPLRLGKFTGSIAYELIPGPKGGVAVRDKCIRKRAEEAVTGIQESFKAFATEHGKLNEFEGIEQFRLISGKIIESSGQEFLQIDENSGATPDFFEKDFNDIILATGDIKCPISTFFDQKMMIINNLYPQWQNTPLHMYTQAQMQMKGATIYNASKGHPPVNKHYLVRYLTSSVIDDDGLKVEIDLPLESRLFWKEISFDEAFYNDILQPAIDSGSVERDAYIKIFKQQIIWQK